MNKLRICLLRVKLDDILLGKIFRKLSDWSKFMVLFIISLLKSEMIKLLASRREYTFQYGGLLIGETALFTADYFYPSRYAISDIWLHIIKCCFYVSALTINSDLILTKLKLGHVRGFPRALFKKNKKLNENGKWNLWRWLIFHCTVSILYGLLLSKEMKKTGEQNK